MYNHTKAQQSKNGVYISWDILYSALAALTLGIVCRSSKQMQTGETKWYPSSSSSCLFGFVLRVRYIYLTALLLSIEHADWPKLLDMFKARRAAKTQSQLPVSPRAFNLLFANIYSWWCYLYRKQRRGSSRTCLSDVLIRSYCAWKSALALFTVTS